VHSTLTFQPPLLETHLLTIALRDHDYAVHVVHTSDLHRRRVVLTWLVAVRLLFTRTPSIVILSTRSKSIHGGAGCSDFPRIRRDWKTISRDFEQLSCKLFMAAQVLTFETSLSRVCAINYQISVISVFYDCIFGMTRTQVSSINCV